MCCPIWGRHEMCVPFLSTETKPKRGPFRGDLCSVAKSLVSLFKIRPMCLISVLSSCPHHSHLHTPSTHAHARSSNAHTIIKRTHAILIRGFSVTCRERKKNKSFCQTKGNDTKVGRLRRCTHFPINAHG